MLPGSFNMILQLVIRIYNSFCVLTLRSCNPGMARWRRPTVPGSPELVSVSWCAGLTPSAPGSPEYIDY